jgi:hypothetical protein
LEELAKKCEEQTALLEEYKIRHGQDTATAKQLSQLVEQKDEEVKKFSNELTQLKTGLEKVELRLSETVGERGSVNNWESNQRKIDEDNEAKFARLQVIQTTLTNFESMHIPEMKTIYEQVKKTYAKMDECMKDSKDEAHEAAKNLIKQEMDRMVITMNEMKEIRSEVVATAIMLEEVKPIAQTVHKAMEQVKHIKSYEELAQEVETIRLLLVENGTSKISNKGLKGMKLRGNQQSSQVQQKEIEAIVKRIVGAQIAVQLKQESVVHAIEKVAGHQCDVIATSYEKAEQNMENQHKARLDELQSVGKEQIALLKVATDENNEELAKSSAEEEMSKMQKQIDKATTRITLSNTMDANGRMALRTEMSALQGRMNTTNTQIEEMTPKISEVQTQIKDVIPRLEAVQSSTTPTTPLPTKQRFDGFEDPTSGRRTIIANEIERIKYIDKGWDCIFMTFDEDEAIKWMNTQKTTPNPTDQNSESPSTSEPSPTEDGETTDKDEKPQESSEDEEPYKPHDPRSNHYQGQHDKRGSRRGSVDANIVCDACHMRGHPASRCHSLAGAANKGSRNNKHPSHQHTQPRNDKPDDNFDYQGYIQDQYDQSRTDYDFQRRQNEEMDDLINQSRHFDYLRYQEEEAYAQGWDSTELDVENEMRHMRMHRDDYGYPFYESMGDKAYRDERPDLNRNDYTTGNWKQEQQFRQRNGPYRGPPQEEWTPKSHTQAQYEMPFDQDQWDRPQNRGFSPQRKPHHLFATVLTSHNRHACHQINGQ